MTDLWVGKWWLALAGCYGACGVAVGGYSERKWITGCVTPGCEAPRGGELAPFGAPPYVVYTPVQFLVELKRPPGAN